MHKHSSFMTRKALASGLLSLVLAACVQGSTPTDSKGPGTAPPPPDTSAPPGLTPPPAVPVTPPPSTPPLTPSIPSTVAATADGRWDSAATWGGKVPGDGDVVSIPRGRTVELAGKTANLNGLWVDGTLTFGNADVSLTTRFAVVSGRWEIGSPAKPFTRKAEVVLTGTDTTQNIMGMGTKMVGVVNGGLIQWHGEPRLSWTQLASNAPVGGTSITLKDSTATWRAGDRLALAPGGFDPREAEVVTVTGVSGSSVNFSPALKHARYALVQTIEGKTLDQRPEVALLSRNIRVRGADDSEAQGFGGHIMVMEGGNAQVSGVELFKMGQRGRFGRYPMHWHVAGDRPGNYIMASAIHDSFQRAVVIHSSNRVTVDGTVAYDVPNHAYVWAEDGDEHSNTLSRNLAMRVRSPEESDFAFAINNPLFGNSSQGEHRSAAYWGRSFDRHLIQGNVSAGVLDGFGFFFDLFTPAPQGDNEGGGLVFNSNVAHATYKEMAIGNQLNYPEATRGHGLMVTAGSSGQHEHVFQGYTAYHNTNGAWLEDRSTRLKDSILADNGQGVMVLRGVVDGVTVVGKSANPVPIQASASSINFGEPGAIVVSGSNHGGKRAPVIANATIVNHDGPGIIYDVDNISPQALVQNLRFVNTPERFRLMSPLKFEFPWSPTFGLDDPSGKIAGDGAAVRWMTYDSALVSANCTANPGFNAFVCPMAESLLLESAHKITLADTTGPVSFVEWFGYDDNSMPDQGATSLVGHNRRYEVLSDDARSRHEITLRGAAGKSLELAFAAPSAPSRVGFGGQTLAAAASLAALRSSSGSGQFYDAGAGRLYVKLVGGSDQPQTAVLEGNFPANTTPVAGRPAVVLPTGAVDGFTASVYGNAAQYGLRYAVPGGAPSSTVQLSGSTINDSSATAALGAGAGNLTVLRGHINAPTDGMYRFALWAGGGGTSLYVGDTWVMGQPWAFINSNFVKNGQFDSEVVPYLHPNGLVSLKVGWHAITAVHARMPENKEGLTVDLRWATPQNPDVWVYPQVKRAP